MTIGWDFEQTLNLQAWRNTHGATLETSISDDHMSELFWTCGDPTYSGPYSENPYYSGGMNAAAVNSIRRRLFSFPCKFCGSGITFVNKKPFDPEGPHRCLSRMANTAV